MRSTDQWQYLLQQYLDDKATAEESMQLFQALQRNDVDWETLLVQAGLQQEKDPAYRKSDWTAMIEQIAQQPARKSNIYFMNRWWIAAAVTVCIVCGLWFIVGRSKRKQPVTDTIAVMQDIMPGRQGAILTLSDGRQIVIDSAGNGKLAQEGDMIVLRDGAQLVYEQNKTGSWAGDPSAIVYNMLSTPRGRQFQLVLPDGSAVWLNAASSIRYPVTFTGNERRVEITGEVYFEIKPLVAKGGEKIPFKVIIPPGGGGRGAEVEVLGTHFNVNAYTDEPAITTTLLEGKVKVVNGDL